MKFRPVRGTLEEAMNEMHELPPTKVALVAHMQGMYEHYVINPERVEVKKYAYDHRINWDTYLVTVNGDAMGYTDGPLES